MAIISVVMELLLSLLFLLPSYVYLCIYFDGFLVLDKLLEESKLVVCNACFLELLLQCHGNYCCSFSITGFLQMHIIKLMQECICCIFMELEAMVNYEGDNS